MNKIKVGLVGISGYTGMELARLLTRHPGMELSMACSRNEAGRKLSDFYPFLRHLPGADLIITSYDVRQAAEKCELVFLAVPAGTAMRMAEELVNAGIKVVDFSADFRLQEASVYEEWYKLPHTASHLLESAVYGLPELYENEIKKAILVANPGCYPTATLLGLFPVLKQGLINPESIIIDAKSGASGAGRKAVIPNLFCEISDDFRAYGIPGHRHTPEIEQEISKIAQKTVSVTFTPHLVPMKRGILATIYAVLASAQTLDSVHKIYCQTYANYPWIRVLPLNELPRTINTRGSMFCDIGLVHDERNNRLLILSAIDNLCRGASGQALASANLMCGLGLTAGLRDLSPLV